MALLSLIVIFSAASLMALAGRVFLLRNPEQNNFGAAYFLGTGLFLALWRITEYILGNALYGLALSVIVISIMAVKVTLSDPPKVSSVTALMAAVFIGFIPLVYWSQSPISPDVLANFGSLHTGRYVNIANYITAHNRIPILGQNFEQSLLASLPGFFGLPYASLALSVWLCVSICAIGLLLYELFLDHGFSKWTANVSTIIILFGQTALSLYHCTVIDSGSPIGLSGYSDAVRGVGSFFVIINLLSRSSNIFLTGLMVAIFTMSWCASAPQNLWLLATILVSIWLVSVRSLPSRERLQAKVGILMLTVTFLLGRNLGGMLSPTERRDNVKITGLMNATPVTLGAISLEPAIPYLALEKFQNSNQLNQYVRLFPKVLIRSLETRPLSDWLFLIETQLWVGIRMIFFPLLGICLLGLSPERSEARKLDLFWKLSLISFVAGAVGTYFFTINGERWVLTRFMMPGYALSMACFLLWLNNFQKSYRPRVGVGIWIAITIILTTGPLIHVIEQSLKNLQNRGFHRTFQSVSLNRSDSR